VLLIMIISLQQSVDTRFDHVRDVAFIDGGPYKTETSEWRMV